MRKRKTTPLRKELQKVADSLSSSLGPLEVLPQEYSLTNDFCYMILDNSVFTITIHKKTERGKQELLDWIKQEKT